MTEQEFYLALVTLGFGFFMGGAMALFLWREPKK